MTEVSVELAPPEKITQVMCGHCKYTCQDIEELKGHMKANHLQNIAGEDSTKIKITCDERLVIDWIVLFCQFSVFFLMFYCQVIKQELSRLNW